jgi:signal transduction histidine kinase
MARIGPRTAVIVDDHAGFRLQAARTLEAAGYEVVGSCPDAHAALELLAEVHPDVVLVDVQLPDIDGFGLIERLGPAHPAGGAAVVLVSSRDAADYGGLVGRSGAAGFIAKAELSPRSLAAVVPEVAVPTVATAAYVAGVVATVLVAGGFALGVHLPNLHNGLLAVAFTAMGVFVLHHRPGNREAGLFVAVGVAHAAMFFGRQYGLFAADHASVDLPAVEWVTWIGVWPLPLVLALVGVTIMSFPDGRLPEPRARWRLVVATMTAAGVALAVISALWPVEYAENSLPVDHPLHVGGAAAAQDLWSFAGPAAYLGFQVAWLACLVARLRRAGPDEVQQVKWFASGVALASAAMMLGLVVFGTATLGVLVAPLIPVAAGAAILRYRLYDIDLVINKTLVVGTMAALVSAAYVGLVAGIGELLGVSDSPHLALSLVATAGIALAFDPVRRRVQGWADRLVHGDRPTPYEALARLSEQLGHTGEHDALLAGLASTVADGVGAAEVTLWVGSENELVAVASWPPPPAGEHRHLTAVPTEIEALGRRARTHVRRIVHQGRLRGAVTLTKAPGEVLTSAEERLLGDLAAQAGLVIDNVGLGAELQDRLHEIAVQAAELRAAAQRIVAAQDEARRRIERDLHDGAQQRLVTLALSLQSLGQRAAANGDVELAADAGAARHELLDALAELREMARGIHPMILVEEGLEAALAFLAERSPVPVDVDVRLDRRLGPAVEATAYFVVSEALTNVAKHADADTVSVTVALDGERRLGEGRLTIEVVDDGRGGAEGRRAGGLQGLTDRLATIDGSLTVDSPAGRGTRLRAEIPCG